MDDKIIKEIVYHIFEKAKKGNASHTMYALSRFLEDKVGPSYQTFKRAHEKYIDGKEDIGPTSPENVNLFCQYLGFEGYIDFKEQNNYDEKDERDRLTTFPKEGKITNQNPVEKEKNKTSIDKKENITPKKPVKRKWSLTLNIVIAFGAVLIATSLFLKDKIQLITPPPPEEQRCMVWKEDHYEEVTCSWKSSTQQVEYDEKLIDKFQKIEVNVNTQFFFEDGLARIWYYKKPNGEIDYFTANGNHPIYKRDVREISLHIINKYVFKSPFNTSFSNTANKEELALFIFNKDALDIELAKQLQKTIFSNYRSTPYFISEKKLNPQLRQNLKLGDLSMYKSDIKKHIDYLCIGSVNYTYKESGMKPKRLFNCDLQLSYDVFDAKGNLQLDKSYSKIITGSGFTKEEAKQNSIKKIAL